MIQAVNSTMCIDKYHIACARVLQASKQASKLVFYKTNIFIKIKTIQAF
jgi:hypothetical protein